MRRKLLLCSMIAMMTTCIMACGSDKQPEEPGIADMGVQEESSALEKEPEEALEEAVDSEAESEEDQKQPEETQENPVEQEEVDNAFRPQATNPDEEIFIRFLNNEIEAVFSETFQNDIQYACRVSVIGDEDVYTFSGEESLTYEELKAAVDASEINGLDVSEEERYYAFLTTIDGGEVFAVKFQNLGIYCQGDNSYAVFFFAVNDGELYVTYAYDDWARSATTIKEPLLLNGGGSSGAGDHLGWSGYIDKTGQYREIYSAEYLSDEWVTMEAYYRYDLDLDRSQCEGCTLELLEMQDRKYYCYYYYDDKADEFTDIELFADFCAHLEEDGMRKIEIDEEMNMIDAAYEEIGFTETRTPFDNWIAWD